MMSAVTCPQSNHDHSTKCSVTVLIPCLNESKTIERCVRKARAALNVLHEDGEVLVVDNGSTDDTVERATSSGARVVICSAKGYGNAIRFGIECAHGDYIVMADGDDSYDLSAIEPFVRLLREGADLVIGDRFAGTIMPVRHAMASSLYWKSRVDRPAQSVFLVHHWRHKLRNA